MKYLDKSFSSRPASKQYRDNWTRTFNGKSRLADAAEAVGMKVIRKADCAGPYQGYKPVSVIIDEMSNLTESQCEWLLRKATKREKAK